MPFPTNFHLHALRALPNELWITIFSHIDLSTLYQVVLTNTRLYTLGISVLHRNIVYKSPHVFEKNLAFWERVAKSSFQPQPKLNAILPKSMHPNTRSVTFAAFSYIEVTTDVVYYRSDSIRSPRSNTSEEYDFAQVFTFIETFADLRSLAFRGLDLPRGIYVLLSRLSSLRVLTIVNGKLPDCAQEDDEIVTGIMTLGSPQLRELHLGGNCWPRPHTNFVVPHRLTMLPTLRILKMDWHSETAILLGLRIWRDSEPVSSSGVLSRWDEKPRLQVNLEHVELTTRIRKEWTRTTLTQDMPVWIHHLLVFLRSCSHSLKSIVINGYLSGFGPDISLPLPQLKSYEGPVHLLSGIEAPSLEHVKLTDDEQYVDAACITRVFRRASGPLRLVSLQMTVDMVSMELVDLIRDKMPYMQELKIRALKATLLKRILFDLGTTLLATLSTLRVLHVYDVQSRFEVIPRGSARYSVDRSFLVDILEEEILKRWKPHTLSLREARFTTASIWKRATEQENWEEVDIAPVYQY
ncbi:hypothetical protein Moror_1915 [Moniliophthora roreri MCA 2997]|uniref:F-box domain-containing protein n=1 Tax=Moniliophthora roreri (strain MCA 2997) TaxID=1381753 RepID=V2X5D4_MONRO|nr:hypothetical protein Moror_1915 [Moniliophthora roreri MCA 2997]